MADEECDLEALSALLEEDSDGGAADCESSSQAAESYKCHNVPAGHVCEKADQDEADLDALAALLEEDSEPEDVEDVPVPHSQGEIWRPKREGKADKCAEPEGSTSVSASGAPSNPALVKKLQDELALMQQRMLEIQKMIASSQSQTPQAAASVSPATEKSSNLKPASTNTKPSLQILKDGDENMFFGEPRASPSSSSSLSSSRLNSTDLKARFGKHSNTHTDHSANDSSQRRTSRLDFSQQSAERTGGLPSRRPIGGGASSQKSLQNGRKSIEKRTSVKVEAHADMQDHTHVGMAVEKPDTGCDEMRVTKADLFGDDSDSDWEDMDGEKPTLSAAGKEIKKLLKSGPRQRRAHVPSYSPPQPPSSTSSLAWKEKHSPPSIQISSTAGQASKQAVKSKIQADAEEDKNFITEKKSNIRIFNPVMSSSMLQAKMEGRRLIQLSTLHRKVNTPDIQGDWVTMGVIVHKTDTRKSANGNTFCILKLSDLQDMDETVSFFLFGQLYKQLWKTDVGAVMGILNPDIMDPVEKNPGEVSFTVKNSAQVMLLGQSKDLGWCIGKTKRGNKCSKFINKKQGEYCQYHVQAAYKKTSARRGELQGGCPGRKPKSFKDKFHGAKSKCSSFWHEGQFFHTGSQKTNDRDKLTVAKLQEEQLHHSGGKVTTMSVQELPPLAQDSNKGKLIKDNDRTFLEMVKVPSAGSMNLVKHLAKNGGHETVTKDSTNPSTSSLMQASDLLKEHKKTLQEKRQSQGQLKTSVPMLGKGFYPGQDIDLFSENSLHHTSRPTMSKNDIAKLKAIKKVQARGGIEKMDPNSAWKSSHNTEHWKKHVLEQVENDSSKRKMSDDSSQSHGSGEDSDKGAPVKKKSRLLGDVDLNSEEIRRLLKAKSSHKGALAEAEAEREEKYFDNLEKREMMEEKMKSVTSLETTVFTCAQCKYTALSVAERCKQEGHTVTKHKGKKRFFQCKKCQHRLICLQKFPTESCKNCGELSFEKTSMLREKSGPKLESEILCIRGDEIKYWNSLNQKVYLNS